MRLLSFNSSCHNFSTAALTQPKMFFASISLLSILGFSSYSRLHWTNTDSTWKIFSSNLTFVVLCSLYRVIERRFVLIFQKKFHSRNNIILFMCVCLFCKENYFPKTFSSSSANKYFFVFGSAKFSRVNRAMFGKFLFNNPKKFWRRRIKAGERDGDRIFIHLKRH